MSSDLEVIRQLEKELGIELDRSSQLLVHIDGYTITTTAYQIDTNRTVVGLALNSVELNKLPLTILKLEGLTHLSLYNNLLTESESVIWQMKTLTYLDLQLNQFRTLPPEIGQLVNLTHLNLDHNDISELPREITDLPKLEVLKLYNNRLERPPPEIADRGVEAVFEYMRQLQAETIEHREAKLILVGQGDVGKTCLVKRLIFDMFEKQLSTEGIDISKWDIKAPTAEEAKIRLNIWDFGGQEIYHATHQFFLTKRSIYLLVWNARKSKDYEHIYYWLHTIEAFGADSPVILVMTKVNERDDDLNMKDLREKFRQIIGLYKVDSEDGTGIPDLKKIISNVAWELPHMRAQWIDPWFRVRERLENREEDWIDFGEFQKVCRLEGLNDKQTDILDEYLHDLGVIIHFRDSLKLHNVVILEPEWATKAVYRVLDSQSVRDQGGILLHRRLEKIWDTKVYPRKLFPALLDLMHEFELAYELPNRKSHLIAELLPSTEPEIPWDGSDNLRFYYLYDFLPASVITRFIVLVHEDLEPRSDGTQLCWREGAVVRRESSRAFVRVRKVEKLIEIRIKGNQQRELLAIIRREFDRINSTINKLQITKEIPCNCSDGCHKNWSYDNLLKLERKGITQLVCDESGAIASIPSLLDGYQPKEERERATEELLRAEAGHHIIIQTPATVIERQFELAGKEERKWYQALWAIIAGIVILVGGIWSAIQMYEWYKKKSASQGENSPRIEQQINPQTQPNGVANTEIVVEESVDTYPR